MKKMLTLAMMLVMLFAFSITANANSVAASPSGKPITEEGSDVITSPKTSDSEGLIYGLGTAAVVLTAGAVILRKKAM